MFADNPEVLPLKLIRMIFQDGIEPDTPGVSLPKMVLVIDMEEKVDVTTKNMKDLTRRMEMALPGIFPDDDSLLAHDCGGEQSGMEAHPFKEEVEEGTHIPHLLEHVIMYLMSKRTNRCAAYCGQRFIDLEQGLCTHYYLVFDYPSKLEAVVAVDLAMQLVSAWIDGKTVVVDADDVLHGVTERLTPMVTPPEHQASKELLAS